MEPHQPGLAVPFPISSAVIPVTTPRMRPFPELLLCAPTGDRARPRPPRTLFPSFLPLPLTPCSLPPEWFASSTQSYILRDLDDTSVVEDGRKKLNTLAHYKVGSQPPPSPPPPAASLT